MAPRDETADALLRTIRADPADDLPRLVYADWLDEHDDPARAEFVRVQCELARLPDHDPRYADLEDREHALLGEHEYDWLGDATGLIEWTFRRGFVDEIRIDPATPPATDFVAAHAVTDLTLAPADGRLPPHHLLAHPLFETVRELDASPASHAWPLAEFAELFNRWDTPTPKAFALSGMSELSALGQLLRGTPFARMLKSLHVGGQPATRSTLIDASPSLTSVSLVQALADAPLESLTAYDCDLSRLDALLNAGFAPTLTALDVSYNPVGPEAHRSFANAPAALRLKTLDVSGTALCGFGLIDVLQARCCAGLTSLAMNNAGSARFNLERLAEAPYWHQAESLSVHRGTVPVVAFEALALHPGPPALRSLDLGDNFLGAEGVRLLGEATWARPIAWLNLAANHLDNGAVRHLAAGGTFTNLRTLHLGDNSLELPGNEGHELTDSAVEHLVRAASLSRLRVLTLSGNRLTQGSVEMLLSAPHFALSGLGLGRLDLTPAAVRALASSPRLARLNWLDVSDSPRLHGDALLPLAESPYLSPLCDLDVRLCGASARVREALRERLGGRCID